MDVLNNLESGLKEMINMQKGIIPKKTYKETSSLWRDDTYKWIGNLEIKIYENNLQIALLGIQRVSDYAFDIVDKSILNDIPIEETINNSDKIVVCRPLFDNNYKSTIQNVVISNTDITYKDNKIYLSENFCNRL